MSIPEIVDAGLQSILAGFPRLEPGHVWLAGAQRGSSCGPEHGLPPDTLMLSGHWGQVVAAIPSREAVIVRLGMTPDRNLFSRCAFVRSILASLTGEGTSEASGR